MKMIFPKKRVHNPKYYIIDAKDKILGRLSTQVSKLLIGKDTSYYTPGVDQGNYVIIINANKIRVSGNKEIEKIYCKNNQRPGSLKKENLFHLRSRIPNRILEKAIFGMMPKGVLGRGFFRRLYIYSGDKIVYKNQLEYKNSLDFQNNLIQI